MCEFCRNWHDGNTVCGKDIELVKYENSVTKNLSSAQILKNLGDKRAGVVLFENKTKPLFYFDISYCPFCGRKLV